MNEKPYTDTDKWIIASMTGLLFLLISSPYFYTLTNWLLEYITKLPNLLANESGRPKVWGLILHTLLFIGIIRLMIR